MKNTQSGFTLAEVTVVIVVLGILAAFFMPKFEQLIVDARIAKVQRLAGTLQEAATIAHATQIAEQLVADDPVDLNGTAAAGGEVQMAFRYPTATNLGISAAIDSYISGSIFGADSGQFTDDNAGNYALNGTTDCSVAYAEPTAIGLTPTVTLDVSGCL